MICGRWYIKLFLESLDSEDYDLEVENDEGLIDLNPCGNGYHKARISAPKNKLSAEQSETPYHRIVAITYLTSCKIKPEKDDHDRATFKPGPLIAIIQFPLLQFYNEGIDI